jgi:hypothetical protein
LGYQIWQNSVHSLSSEYTEESNCNANKMTAFLRFIHDKFPDVEGKYKNGLPYLTVVTVYVIIDWSLGREGSL